MPSDFGDDSGEKMVDWMLSVGQDAGDSVMVASAEKLKGAFRKARAGSTVLGEAGPGDESEIEGKTPEWARLSMKDFEELPEYASLREIIDKSLDKAAVEHDFYAGKDGREWLLFKVEDARDVSEVFRQLEDQADKAIDLSLQRRGKTREQVRDEESLDARAKNAREASKAIDASRNREREIERLEVRSK